MYDTRRGAAPAAIDLRSDTFTKPTAAMRKAMAEADVGDDVYGEDPTVNRLEAVLAERLGKEAAMFCASGTQSNLCGVWSHCDRGDEFIIADSYHVFKNEAGGAAVLASAIPAPMKAKPDGSLCADEVAALIKQDDVHVPITRLLSLENTTGGKAQTPEMMAGPIAVARNNGMVVHLDGARVFNATVALGMDVDELVAPFDTVSICLSKGLGAPVGSVLVGPAENIYKARRARKMLGGGMRQAGILAAAGLHALEHHVDRLADDHDRASRLAAALLEHPGISLVGGKSNTNMMFVQMDSELAEQFSEIMAEGGINVGPPSPTIRLVTHLNVSDDDIEKVIGQLGKLG